MTGPTPRVPLKPGAPGTTVRPSAIDGLTVLSVYLVLLYAVPSSLTITALGSAGRPASLWALASTMWWCWYQLQRHASAPTRAQLVSRALLLFLAVGIASYAWAMLRGLPVDEVSPADNGLLRLLAWAGILLVANDGLTSAAEFRLLLWRISWAGALLAVLGILQFLTGSSLLDWISLPGMSSDLAGLAGLDARGGFTRASATASHPLEYGVVLCVAFPIALTLAMEDYSRSRSVRWIPAGVIAVASVLSVSRSALIGLVVGVLVLLPTWSRASRALFGALGSALVVIVGILVPGLIGTIRGLFAGITTDPSAVSRTSSYEAATELIGRFPFVGKGFGTLLPRYHIFDNQYVLLGIELGLVGLAAFLALFICAIVSAASARARAFTSLDRQLSQSLIAGIISGAVLLAFFDGLSFPMAAGTVFLVLGLCGSARRLLGESWLPSDSANRNPIDVEAVFVRE
jgi:hypothetical protein